MQPKIKIGQAYQPTRFTRRGANGSYSALRPYALDDTPENRFHRVMDRIVFGTAIACAIAVGVMLCMGIIQ